MPSIKLSVTVRGALERKYNAAALKQIDGAVKDWIAADAKRGIKTIHVAVDDAAGMKALGATAVTGRATAEKVKRAIDGLWTRLTPDYLALFGSQDVVPQFVVDNPSYDEGGDDDKTVPTDNPYASSSPFQAKKRASYLIPDRVVGRIPDMEADGDPAWFTDYLATAASSTPADPSVFHDAYTICAEAWTRAGAACVNYLGLPAALLMNSPPEVDTSPTAQKRLAWRLHMIKCHGAQLDPRFYGQKGDSYPVALSSANLIPRVQPGTLVAAMCCYGAQVYSPADLAAQLPGDWPLASAYLRKGAPGFVGSTMIAWVGGDEMMGADWIAAGYLKGVLGSASIGRAFLEAKQDYVRWINQQGHGPDRADEKTLIEFVLLGDPSIQPVQSAAPAFAAMVKRRAAIVSPLELQERRQRRVMRAQLAQQIREMLPVRTGVKRVPAARASKLFKAARKMLEGDHRAFRFRPHAPRVDRLETRLPGTAAPVRAGIAAAARPVGKRESVEYYWSGRRVLDGHKQIRLLKVETDIQGNVLRSAVLHSS